MITSRWFGGSASIARETSASVSLDSSRSSGVDAHPVGGSAQRPGEPGWPSDRNRSGSTDGSTSGSAAQTEEKGTLRASRCPRVFAVFTRIRKIHVRSDERPSKPSSPFSTPTQASWTTSSATARVETYIRAMRSIAGW